MTDTFCYTYGLLLKNIFKNRVLAVLPVHVFNQDFTEGTQAMRLENEVTGVQKSTENT